MQIITKEDLEIFKLELFKEINDIFKDKSPVMNEWIKTKDVRKILGLSLGTLQNLRINGTLAYSKIGGLMFYRRSDIVKLLESNYIKATKLSENNRVRTPKVQNRKPDIRGENTFKHHSMD